MCVTCYDKKDLAKAERESVNDEEEKAPDKEESTTSKEEKNVGGRPKKEIDKQKLFQLKKDGKNFREIAKALKTSPASVHRALKKAETEK